LKESFSKLIVLDISFDLTSSKEKKVEIKRT